MATSSSNTAALTRAFVTKTKKDLTDLASAMKDIAAPGKISGYNVFCRKMGLEAGAAKWKEMSAEDRKKWNDEAEQANTQAADDFNEQDLPYKKVLERAEAAKETIDKLIAKIQAVYVDDASASADADAAAK